MKFITAEQFSKADKKVRDSIMEWWEPSIGDLMESKMGDKVWCLCSDRQAGRVKEIKDKTEVIPLLTVGQLIEFVEWKLGDEIDIYRAGMKGHQISTEWIDGVGESKYEFRNDNHNLLESLWEVAQKV